MTNKKPEALIFADDRPSEIGDDLYQWASDSEDMIRRLHTRIVELESQLAVVLQEVPVPQVLQAAQAVVERWDTPLWKDVPATAVYIADLRSALAAQAEKKGK